MYNCIDKEFPLNGAEVQYTAILYNAHRVKKCIKNEG